MEKKQETLVEGEQEWTASGKAKYALIGLATAGLLAAGGLLLAKRLKSD